MNRDRRSYSSFGTFFRRTGAPIPSEKPVTAFDPVGTRKPGPQTQAYYGSVAYSFKRRNPLTMPTAMEADPISSSEPRETIISSNELSSYGHSSVFSTEPTTEEVQLLRRKLNRSVRKTTVAPLAIIDNYTTSEAAKFLVSLSG